MIELGREATERSVRGVEIDGQTIRIELRQTCRTMPIDVQPLIPERFEDLASLFEQGGDPRWCWCTYFRSRGRDWTNSTPAGNRAELAALAERDTAPGLIAYDGDRAVGWVSLGPRPDYERLAFSKLMAPIDDAPVWSIVCFVVSRGSRRQGIADRLLAAAIDHARDQGATILEGYPVDTSGGRISAASAYHGTLGMFERAGFKVIERRQWNTTSPVRPIVRLDLESTKARGTAARTRV